MDLLVVSLAVLPVFDWIAAAILAYLSSRFPELLTLKERAITATICAVIATFAGLLALARLGFIGIPNDAALLLLAFALVLVSLPSLFWLLLLVTGRFRLPPSDPGTNRGRQ